MTHLAELGWPDFISTIEDPRGRRFWVLSDQIFCKNFENKFFNVKSLPRDHTGANVSLANKGTSRDVVIRSI